jgi:hypothetical protein
VTVTAASGGDGGNPGGQTGTGAGLFARYYTNTSLAGSPALQRTEAINFNWGTGSPAAGGPVDNFSVRWQGRIEAPVTGNYQLQTNSDDGVRVWVNGSLVINNWTQHSPTLDNSPVLSATAGQRYNIVVEYFELGGGAQIELRWKTPGASGFVPVPPDRLYTP